MGVAIVVGVAVAVRVEVEERLGAEIAVGDAFGLDAGSCLVASARGGVRVAAGVGCTAGVAVAAGTRSRVDLGAGGRSGSPQDASSVSVTAMSRDNESSLISQ